LGVEERESKEFSAKSAARRFYDYLESFRFIALT